MATSSETPTVSLREAADLLAGDALFLDVREQGEWDLGHVPEALHIPLGVLEDRVTDELPDREREVVVYCAHGRRSLAALATLRALGYERSRHLSDGFEEWEKSGFPVVVPSTLEPDQRRRYSRHLLIPELGEAGQRRLLESSVLLIGAGGLGSPASLYLAAAGVGTLGIVDDDVVDESNLQRQIAHSTQRLGDPKVESARDTLTALNPDVEVKTFNERLSSENIDRILAEGWDVIVDGADNFPTRYLVNDASVWHGIPVVHGSIYRFEGQATVFQPGEGPCYRCLFPTPPPPELAPSCAEGGVLGVLPGVIGSLQANETIKLAGGDRRAARRPAAALRRAQRDLHRGDASPRPGLPRLRRAPDRDRVHRLRGVLRGPMSVVRIPPTLRADTGGEREVIAEGDTVRDLLDDLMARFPTLDGKLEYANVYVGGEDIRTRDGFETPVSRRRHGHPPAGDGGRWPLSRTSRRRCSTSSATPRWSS